MDEFAQSHRSIDLAEHLTDAKITSLGSVERLNILRDTLQCQEINIKTLGRLACTGLPEEQHLRAQVWQLLLGYLPVRRAEWQETLRIRRAEYGSFCDDFNLRPDNVDAAADDDPLSDKQGSAWGQYFRDLEGMEQIARDVERTHQTHPFFSADSPSAAVHHREMKRVLFVFSKLNPGLQYVQGMNELIAPLYMVFKTDAATAEDAACAEADCFFCFVKLLTLSEVRDLYCKSLDSSSTGVKAVLSEFMDSLARSDPTVAAHLRQHNVDPHFFAFRWMTVLFSQDVAHLPVVLRVWDFLFGDARGCKDAMLRFCAALILRRRTKILAAAYPELVKVVQSCGREDFDVEETVSVAMSLSPVYML